MDSTGGSKGVELHASARISERGPHEANPWLRLRYQRSVTEEATATKKNDNTATAEPTLVESLVNGRLNIDARTGKSGQVSTHNTSAKA